MPLFTAFSGGFGSSIRRRLSLPRIYALNRTSTFFNEGASTTFNVVTANVPDGTVLYWTVSHPDDVTPSSGSVTVNNNAASFSVTAIEDVATEGTEYLTASLRTDGVDGPIVATSLIVSILDTSQAEPTYAISPAGPLTVNEGTVITFTVTTTNVLNGTRFYWFTSPSGDIAPSGNFLINNNTGSFNVNVFADQIYDGSTEVRTLTLMAGQFGPTVATVTINILDTSQDTVTIYPSASVIEEGQSLQIVIETPQTPTGYVYYWTVSRPEDFVEGSGSVTIGEPQAQGYNGFSGVFTITALLDAISDNDETFTISIRRGSVDGEILATSDPITIIEPVGFIFSPNDAFFDSAVEVRIGWINEDDYNAFSGFLNAAKEGEMTISTVGGNFTNFNSFPPADAGFSSINATFSTPATTQTFGDPTDFWRIAVPISYTNPIDPDPFGADSIEIPITIQASSSLNENELTNVSWQRTSSLSFQFNGEYSIFNSWAQANPGGTFVVRYSGVNYYITFSQVSNSSDYGNGSGFVSFNSSDYVIGPAFPDIGFDTVSLTWLKFYAPRQTIFYNNTLDEYSRNPNTTFSEGESVFTFSSPAAAEEFAATMSEIGSIRANSTLCAPFSSQFFNIDINPSLSGPGTTVTFSNSVAATAVASGSSVTLAHVSTNSNDPSSGSGNWYVTSSLTYQDSSGFGSLVYSSGSATLTLPSAVAETLAQELSAAGVTGYGLGKRLSIRSDIGGSTAFVLFEEVTGLSGSGSELTFSYSSAFNDGDFGPPFLYIQAN